MARRVGRQQPLIRVAVARKLIDDEIKTLKITVDELLEITPVKATVDLVAGTVNNISNFIRKQAELTRKRAR